MRPLALAAALAAVALSAAPVCAGPIPVGIVGDSLSDPYARYQGAVNPSTGLPYWGRGHDHNWVEQLQALHGPALTLYNYAQAGATTADLLANGSVTKAALRVKYFQTRREVVMAGSNDVIAYLGGKLGSDPAAFVAGVAGNLNTILSKIAAAGPVKLVVGNVPDLTVTPSMQALLGSVSGALQSAAALVQALNKQIAAVAAAHGAAVVDLFALSHLATGPLSLGGVTVDPGKYFASDGFHPGTVFQGLVANSLLGAFGGGLGTLRLSDQEILGQAGIPHPDGAATFFDVSAFVQATPEPSTLVLLAVGGVLGCRYRRCRAAA
jgi:phospholipase/lecithinase/hemolysin